MSEERDGIDRPRGEPSGTPGQDPSFEDRLHAARRRQGLAAPRRNEEPESRGVGLSASQGSALGMGMRVGVELVSALAVAVAIGWFLDEWLGTRPFLLILFFLLGGAAGVANVWRLVSPPAKPPRRPGID
jgi:ATP synthase protein I